MATKNYLSMQELINDSIAISTPIRVTHYFGQEEIYTPDVAKFNGCYASNNSTLAYVDNSILYVTPFTMTALMCLKEHNFTSNSFYVPFSNGDYPTDQKAQWEKLRKMAQENHEEAFIEECISYCDNNGIGELPAEELSKCFQIPKMGIRTQRYGIESTYHPLITSTIFDCISIQRIGKFCYNNGKVVFVYRDGKTYVAKGYKILDFLRNAGYEQKGLFVPFSNGEQIIDPILARQWAAL